MRLHVLPSVRSLPCRRWCRQPVLTSALVFILLLNTYFILTLLSHTPKRAHTIQQYSIKRKETSDWHLEGFEMFSAEQYSNKCEILRPMTPHQKEPETPFKIYIYDLPPELNTHLSHCVEKYKSASCFRVDYCGFGPITSRDRGISIHGTWQFSLEVILHHLLQYSPYRTHDASKANVFYVPYYAALACHCHTNSLNSNVQMVQDYLNKSPYYQAGLPHLTTIGKIEREHFAPSCPLLKTLNTTVFRVIGIEEEQGVGVKKAYSRYHKPLILAPYPSYGSFDSTAYSQANMYRIDIGNRDRTVFVFLAAGQRRSNRFRSQVFDSLLSRPSTYKTKYSYEEFLYTRSETDPNVKRYTESKSGMLEGVWLITSECKNDHHRYTLDWMQRSIFCLQPPGDSPTRKSFYDAIFSGCIPVLFKQRYPTKYPFERHINYDKFTVTVSDDIIRRRTIPISTYLSTISPEKIKELQIQVAKVSQYLQYSYPIIERGENNDAVKYLMDEISYFLRTKW